MARPITSVSVLHDHEGRAIRLTSERLAHIVEHPEMLGMEDRLGETLATPTVVTESLSDRAARLYYRYYYYCVTSVEGRGGPQQSSSTERHPFVTQ